MNFPKTGQSNRKTELINTASCVNKITKDRHPLRQIKLDPLGYPNMHRCQMSQIIYFEQCLRHSVMYNVKCCYEITTSRLMEKLDEKAHTLNHHFWKIFTSKFEQNWMRWSEIVSRWQDGFKCLELHLMAKLIELLKWYATKFDAILVSSVQSWIPEPWFSSDPIRYNDFGF